MANSDSEQSSSSAAGASESDNSDASVSDFEIQAVTTVDGTRTSSAQPSAHGHDVSLAESEIQAVTTGDANHTASAQPSKPAYHVSITRLSENSTGKVDDARPDESPPKERRLENHQHTPILKGYDDIKSEKAENPRPRKRVRFADNLPTRDGLSHPDPGNGTMTGATNGHSHATSKGEEEEEVAILDAQLALFDAAITDTNRGVDEIVADLTDAEDAREEAVQLAMRQRLGKLREEIAMIRAQGNLTPRGGHTSNTESEDYISSDSSDESGDVDLPAFLTASSALRE